MTDQKDLMFTSSDTETGINYLDSWEYNYVKNLQGHEVIAWTDEEAWDRYPKLRWVYDKLELSKKMGFQVLESPVFVKPRINLGGMGRGAYSIKKGMIVQEFFEGEHISTDFAVLDGIVRGGFSFRARKSAAGSFLGFASTQFGLFVPPSVVPMLISDGFKDGIINVETIDDRVIDVHLRPSVQFYDICGGLIESTVRSIVSGEILSHSYGFEDTYSEVWRRDADAAPLLSAGADSRIPDGVRSVQYTWEPGKRLSYTPQDSFGFRYLVVNGTDLDAIREFGDMLSDKITFNEG